MNIKKYAMIAMLWTMPLSLFASDAFGEMYGQALINLMKNHNITEQERFARAQELFAHGADINAQDSNGWTALMRAVHSNNIEMVQLLFNHGADVNIRNRSGFRVLYRAILRHNIEMVQLLLDYGADINAQDGQGLTALMWAAYNDNIEIVQLLLDHGADVNAQDDYGRTAFDIARNNEIRNLLEDAALWCQDYILK